MNSLSRLFASTDPWRAAIIAAASFFALLGAGCADAPNSKLEQTIQFESVPSGATVKVDGVPLPEKTPTSAELGKLRETRVTIEKKEFKSVDVFVGPHGGVLGPDPVSVNLRPELLPDTPGTDSAAEKNRAMDILHQYVAMGRIDAADQPYIEKQITQFYQNTSGTRSTPPPAPTASPEPARSPAPVPPRVSAPAPTPVPAPAPPASTAVAPAPAPAAAPTTASPSPVPAPREGPPPLLQF